MNKFKLFLIRAPATSYDKGVWYREKWRCGAIFTFNLHGLPNLTVNLRTGNIFCSLVFFQPPGQNWHREVLFVRWIYKLINYQCWKERKGGMKTHDWASMNSSVFHLILIYFIGSRSRVLGLLDHWYCLLLTLAFCMPGTILRDFDGSVNKLLHKHYEVKISSVTMSQFTALEKEMATCSIILAWRVPWTEAPGELQLIRPQSTGHNWSDLACMPNL